MIEVKDLTKRYGNLTAVNNMTLTIGSGEIFGFIGPNGAGKSTTMKMLSSLIKPDSGTAEVCGHSVYSEGDRIRRVVGYMPDFIGVYDDLTVDEYLQFFAAAFGIPRRERRKVVSGVLELTDLGFKREAMVNGLSRGMSQRLGIARVLIHDPKVLLLDEPASGLDPRARIEMRELLAELGRMGKSLMISSHILTELAELCDTVGIIEQGRLLYSGTLADALRKAGVGEQLVLRIEPGGATPEAIASALAQDERIVSASAQAAAGEALGGPTAVAVEGEVLVALKPGETSHHFIIERAIAAGGRVAGLAAKRGGLEDAFLKLTEGALQ